MHRTLLTVILLCAAPLVAPAAIPGADDPNAYTEHDYRRALLAFHRRTSVDAYERVGRRDPKWDGPVRAFLEAMSRRFAYAGAHDTYRERPQLTLRELAALDKAVQDTGCTDPLVGYFHAAVLAEQDVPYPKVRPLFERASKDLLASDYPITRAWGATFRSLNMSGADKDVSTSDESFDTLKELTVRMLSEWDYQDVDRRILLEAVSNWISAQPYPRQAELAKAIGAGERVDPWVKHVILGWHATKAAWEARGTGYANTVSEAAWKQFAAHLAEAERHLTVAHGLRPDHPEAAHHMITVSMGNDGRNLRTWFDHSVRAQLDFTPAYEDYLYAMMPRWHGTHRQMYQFGVECLETNRFDTRLPWQIDNALHRIANDDDVAFWAQPGVYENMKRMCDGYASKFGVSREGDWYRCYLAAVAWRANRFAESANQMDVLGERFDPSVFDPFKTLPGPAISQAYAMSSHAGAQVAAAEQYASSGNAGDAVDAFRAAFNTLPPEHKGRAYVGGRLQQFQWQRQFDKGNWVKIQPDKNLTGWYPQAGEWEVADDGTLTGTFDRRGLMLLCQNRSFGDSFVLEGTVDMGNDSVAAGIGIAPTDPARDHGIYFYWDRNTGEQALLHDERRGSSLIQLQRVNAFQIVVADGVAGGYLNGKAAFGRQAMYGHFRPTTYLGVGGKWAAKPGTKLRFTNLRIKRHDGPPEPLSNQDLQPTLLSAIRAKTGGMPAWDLRTFAACFGIGAVMLAIAARVLRHRRAKRMAPAPVAPVA